MHGWGETFIWTVITWIFIGAFMHATYRLGHSNGIEGKSLKTWLYGVGAITIVVLVSLFVGGNSENGYDSLEMSPDQISPGMWAKIFGGLVALVLSYTVGYFDGRRIFKALQKAKST